MKKVIRSFSLLFFLMNLQVVDAQVWFQEGDRWVNDYFCCWGQKGGYEEIGVDGDTILDGQLCKVLKSQITTAEIWPDPGNDTIVSVGKSYFVYEQSDSIFGYFENEFRLIYDFSRLDVYEPFIIRESEGADETNTCDTDLWFYGVDSSSMVINGVNRRIFRYVTLDEPTYSNYYGQIITVIEGIGIVNEDGYSENPKFGNIIPGRSYPCYADATLWKFCSFTSNGETYNPGDDDCYELPQPVSTDETSTIPITYDLYPNPASTHFSVQNEFRLPIKNVTIFSAKGNIEKVIPQPTKEIDISDLAKGIYIVEVEIGDGLVYKKLVKQ